MKTSFLLLGLLTFGCKKPDVGAPPFGPPPGVPQANAYENTDRDRALNEMQNKAAMSMYPDAGITTDMTVGERSEKIAEYTRQHGNDMAQKTKETMEKRQEIIKQLAQARDPDEIRRLNEQMAALDQAPVR